jgi:CBS-domain-containing membrane protein
METRQVRRMPVIDDSGRVVGVIAQADIAMRLRDSSKTAEVVRAIFRPRTAATKAEPAA